MRIAGYNIVSRFLVATGIELEWPRPLLRVE